VNAGVIDVDPGIFETVRQDHHPLSSNTDAIEGSGAIGPDCSYRWCLGEAKRNRSSRALGAGRRLLQCDDPGNATEPTVDDGDTRANHRTGGAGLWC